MTRAVVANAVVSSQEAAMFTVQSLFQEFLHRQADSGTVTLFSNLLLTGMSQDTLIAIIVGSSEYYGDSVN